MRRASGEDVETLVGMRLALLRTVGNVTSDSDAKEIGGAIRAYMAQEMPAGRYVALIAEAGECAVGCGGLAFYVRPPYCGNPSGKEAYLMGMYTLAEWRGKGVGTALVQKLLEYAKRKEWEECGYTLSRARGVSTGEQASARMMRTWN